MASQLPNGKQTFYDENGDPLDLSSYELKLQVRDVAGTVLLVWVNADFTLISTGVYEISNLGNCRRIKRGKKLLPEHVYAIKFALGNGNSMLSIAKRFGVSVPTIAMIRDGVTWSGDHGFRPIKPHTRTDFYQNFLFCSNAKYKHYAVHRAVWEAFNGPIPEGMEINHKNLDRCDNRLENLEILTREENIHHAMKYYQDTQGTHQTGGKYHAQKVARRAKRLSKKLGHCGSPE